MRSVVLGERRAAPRRLPPALRGDPVRIVRQEFRRTFCGRGWRVGWCGDVRQLRIDGTTLVGATRLPPGSHARATAAHICSALSTLAYAGDTRLRLASVRVTGVGDRTLSFRPRIGSRCSR